jgi:glutamyl/glutaminyl-tRNA synthetase
VTPPAPETARIDLAALRRRLPPRPLTRFAPSPTGHLHLGHVVNAIHVWGLARALGGRVLVRMEDHDAGRARRDYERSILDDLEWLGLLPDVADLRHLGTGPSPFRQSDCGPRYEAALERLRRVAHVFPCTCTRREVAAAGEGAAAGVETPYPGTCRFLNRPEAPASGLRVDLGDGEEAFEDARAGPQRHEPARQCGALLVRDRTGCWTYQFAVTVDDVVQGVDLVVRGTDLLSSTGRQIRLARLLGRPQPPVFLHHALLLEPGGRKLSKSDGDAGIRELRAAGLTPSEVLGRAAHAVGLLDTPRAMGPEDVRGLFAD